MTILYYTSGNTGISLKLLQVIEALTSKGQIETYKSIPSLSLRLRKPSVCKDIAVLLITTKDDLLEVLSIKDLLDSMRVILILPDRAADTVSRAYTIFPRFLSYADSDFRDVSAVLEKMLRRSVPGDFQNKDTIVNKNDLIMMH